ncbi:aminoglycoside phosphotransferase family protein [Merismopedia glauca]|uniref:Aminoglycoside phosphotransferase domain-containing protein n=1 Tax=Merismopedia glauca CCAP 1448/3 TaxID=1296344 RepID=A0A2T1BZZ2_9CYAN|nr:aminoglycoside phosphotransferase family protein [Merismopedia glauca]PSB01524.1 hypothetical protein C7B64_17835 [Merismopedia glauca CCAP 1448/3]
MYRFLRLIFLTPVFLLTISLEKWGKRWFLLRFPRKPAEILKNQQQFFEMLKNYAQQRTVDLSADQITKLSSGLFPLDSKLLEIHPLAKIINEPDKNKLAGSFEIVYQTGEIVHSLPIFVKFQCGRGLPLYLQAIRAAVELGIAREIDFYRYLAGQIDLRTPRPYYANSIHQFNRVCLVLEYIEGFNPADWRSCPLIGIKAILYSVARMNAAFLGRTSTDPRTAWIPARKGLDYASFIGDFIRQEPVWYRTIWSALVNYFQDKPVTLVHGDCRPGNMLFVDDGKLASQIGTDSNDKLSVWPDDQTPLPEVVFTDWEAINVAPLFWDFTYCTIIGMTVADRRIYRSRLLDEFKAALQAAGVPAELCQDETIPIQVNLLALVLGFLSFVIIKNGFWDRQGNTAEDAIAWRERVVSAVVELDTKAIADILKIPEEAIVQLQNQWSQELSDYLNSLPKSDRSIHNV